MKILKHAEFKPWISYPITMLDFSSWKNYNELLIGPLQWDSNENALKGPAIRKLLHFETKSARGVKSERASQSLTEFWAPLRNLCILKYATILIAPLTLDFGRNPHWAKIGATWDSYSNENNSLCIVIHVSNRCTKRIKNEWKSFFSGCLCKKTCCSDWYVLLCICCTPYIPSRIWNSEEMSRKMF